MGSARTPRNLKCCSDSYYRNLRTDVLGDHPQHRTSFQETIIFSLDRHINIRVTGQCRGKSRVRADPATHLVLQARHGIGPWQSKCTIQYRVTLGCIGIQTLMDICNLEDTSHGNLMSLLLVSGYMHVITML